MHFFWGFFVLWWILFSFFFFIVYRRQGCSTSECLLCHRVIDTAERQEHQCGVDPTQGLYTELLEILAQASVTKCPNKSCGFSGMKDLACTHITCTKCSTKFCYLCGVKPLRGFSGHNQWRLPKPLLPGEQPPSVDSYKDCCPMYLKQKYGNNLDLKTGRYKVGRLLPTLYLFFLLLLVTPILSLWRHRAVLYSFASTYIYIHTYISYIQTRHILIQTWFFFFFAVALF